MERRVKDFKVSAYETVRALVMARQFARGKGWVVPVDEAKVPNVGRGYLMHISMLIVTINTRSRS